MTNHKSHNHHHNDEGRLTPLGTVVAGLAITGAIFGGAKALHSFSNWEGKHALAATAKSNQELSRLPAAYEPVDPGKGAESAIDKLYPEGVLTEDQKNRLNDFVQAQGKLPTEGGLAMLDANQRVIVPELPGLPLKPHENVPSNPANK